MRPQAVRGAAAPRLRPDYDAPALAVIAGQSVYDRRKFVRACGIAMLSDNRAEPAEVETVMRGGFVVGVPFGGDAVVQTPQRRQH